MTAEDYLRSHTLSGSNQIINGNYGVVIPHFQAWITPERAMIAVTMAKGEVIQKAIEWIECIAPTYAKVSHKGGIETVSMEDGFAEDFMDYIAQNT